MLTANITIFKLITIQVKKKVCILNSLTTLQSKWELTTGGIKILYINNPQNILSRLLICTECMYGNTTKGGIKHI